MALNTSKCNLLMPLRFKGLKTFLEMANNVEANHINVQSVQIS